MKKFILLFLITLYAIACGKDYKPQYLDLMKNKDFNKLSLYLKEWEKDKPKDPELFIAYFNYYIYRNSQDGMVVDKDETGQSLGILHEKVSYDIQDVRRGVVYLDKGLNLYPQRLDMHWGKINILGEIKDFAKQKDQIINVLSLIPNNKWLWSDGKKLENSDKIILENIHNRISIFFNINSKEANDYIIEVCNKIIEIYPKTIWPYNYVGAIYLKNKAYDKALQYFKKAEKLDSKDYIVINNIGYLYELQKDYNNSETYYKKMIISEDENIRNRGIQGLKNIGRYK